MKEIVLLINNYFYLNSSRTKLLAEGWNVKIYGCLFSDIKVILAEKNQDQYIEVYSADKLIYTISGKFLHTAETAVAEAIKTQSIQPRSVLQLLTA